jgi:aminocarboxymuconate-semialdehyde decarboxylase
MEPADGGARVLASGPVRFTARQTWFDAERRLAASAASGVDAEVVSPFPPLLNYRLAPGPGRDLARWVNEYVAGLCAAAPGRIYGLGTVPLQDPDLAAAELEDVAKAGLAGVEIASNVGGASLADSRFLGFFAEAERLGTAIFVHAMPTASDRLPAVAAATFGVGVEGALAAAAIVTGGVAEKYPGLRLAFSHAAGGFPLVLTRAQWFWGRTWNEEPPGERGPEAEPWAAPIGPAELARRFYYDSLVFDRRAISYLIDMLGADRLLIGSDFPAMPREQPAGRTLRSMGLPDADLADITWHNCFRFLGIEPSKLFSLREQHRISRADGSRPARAVDVPRRRRAAAAAAAAYPARRLLVAADRNAALGGDRRPARRVRRQRLGGQGRAEPADPQRAAGHVQDRPPHVLPAEHAGGGDPGRRRTAHLLLRRGQSAVGRDVVAGRVLHP